MGTRTTRLAAGALAALAAATVLVLPRGSAPGYLSVLVGSLAVVTLFVAVRLWCTSCFGSRAMAMLLAAAILVGQVLGASIGGPAGEGSRWHFSAIAETVLAGTALVLLVLDARRSRVTDSERRPYAL